MTQYIFDANIFITPQKKKYYSFSTHPAFWRMLEQFMTTGVISSIDEVFKEITGKNRLKKWVDIQKGYFYKLDNSDTSRIVDVTAAAQTWANTKGFTASDLAEFAAGADLYILARAKEKSLTIVTYESKYSALTPVANSHKIKIPDVADILNIPCIDLHDFLVAERIRFDNYSII